MDVQVEKLVLGLPEQVAGSVPRVSRCKVCDGIAELTDVVDFNKTCNAVVQYRRGLLGIPVFYYECQACGFMYTRFFDDWDTEKFARFVYNKEYRSVDKHYNSGRPALNARQLAHLFGEHDEVAMLDYGGGSGMTAQLLRESGYPHVDVYDPFTHPERPQRQYDVVTAIAVVEHSPQPVEVFQDMKSFLRPDGLIVVGTATMDESKRRERGNWWYIAPRNGHVSIFTIKALAALADRLGLELYRRNTWHILAQTRKSEISAAILRKIMYRYKKIVLYAPGGADPRPHNGWGRLEVVAGRPLRWTRSNVASLTLPPLPSGAYHLHLEVNLLRQIRRDFAEGCRFRIGDVEVPAVACEWPGVGMLLTAHADVVDPPREVQLITPEPAMPAEAAKGRTPQPRGLAIAAYGAVAKEAAVVAPMLSIAEGI